MAGSLLLGAQKAFASDDEIEKMAIHAHLRSYEDTHFSIPVPASNIYYSRPCTCKGELIKKDRPSTPVAIPHFYASCRQWSNFKISQSEQQINIVEH